VSWRPFILALLLPIWISVATLASVSRNRSGARDPIVLSDREVYMSPRSGDDTSASVWIAWQPSAAMAARMAPRPPDTSGQEYRSLPRAAYVALEFNGPAFRALPIERERDRTTRLVAIDIDRDADVLESRYPNASTHLISAASVRVPPGASYADAIVLNLDPPRIHVPRQFAMQLPPYDPRQGRPPQRFEIEVRYGRSYEPWVTAVRGTAP
jgi:hypothetical protein